MDSRERPALFPAGELGFSLDEDGTIVPTVLIDAADHPEVSDLARVHAVEGVGDVWTSARRLTTPEREMLLLGIRLTLPVRVAFAVSFVLPDDATFLEAVADHGQLALATTDPALAAEQRPMWLAVDIDGPALRRALEQD